MLTQRRQTRFIDSCSNTNHTTHPAGLRRKKGSDRMSEKEKKILETFGKVIPDLSEMEKEKLLSFGEGMAFMKDKQKKEEGEKKDE